MKMKQKNNVNDKTLMRLFNFNFYSAEKEVIKNE